MDVAIATNSCIPMTRPQRRQRTAPWQSVTAPWIAISLWTAIVRWSNNGRPPANGGWDCGCVAACVAVRAIPTSGVCGLTPVWSLPSSAD